MSGPVWPAGGVPLTGFGRFYAGGRTVRIAGREIRRIHFTPTVGFDWDPNGLHHVEQAYVQWYRPAVCRSELPILLLHGGGYTGAMWEETPDGRPGWLHQFLAQGHVVYVVDNVERGRAGWCPFPEIWAGPAILRSAEECWSLFRFGRAADFDRRIAFRPQRFPIAALETLMRGAVPRFPGVTDAAAAAALTAVVETIGRPVAIVAHSQGGEIALRATMAAPERVAALVLVESSGFLDCDRPLLQVAGDHLDATPLWQGLAARYRDFARRCHRRDQEAWFLPERGIAGNSHMLMMDDNNAEIAEAIGDWLRRVGGGA